MNTNSDPRAEAEAFALATAERTAALQAPYVEAAASRRRARAESAFEGIALARRELAGLGLEPGRLDALDALAAERSQARHELAERSHRRAVDASAEAARRLAGLTPVLPADPMNVIIDRVTFIRSFADAGVVVDSDIGSLDSWARYRFSASADALDESGVGRLSFFTLWRNPRTEPVTVTAGARLVVNAHLSVDAEWNGVAAWFIGGSQARATVRARTTVWAMWDPNVHAIVHDRIIGDAGATGGFFGGDDSDSIAVNEFLPAAGFAVPAQASILIEIEVLTEWVATNGSVELDASDGSFRVEVPHLILTLT